MPQKGYWETNYQGKKNQWDKALKSVRSQIADLQKQAASSDKSRGNCAVTTSKQTQQGQEAEQDQGAVGGLEEQ
eukprot:13546879-Heterocapsa_arctica.AAC.1